MSTSSNNRNRKRNESRIGRKTETIGKRENLLKSTVRIEKEGEK